MANTNTNTGNNLLTTDIYQISEFIDTIRQNTISDIDATSAMVGIFGYITEIHSQSLQDVLIKISEMTNETIPTRAKFHKNVLSHAMNLAIRDILANPAVMTMMIYLPVEYIENNFVEFNPATGRGKFILDRNIPIRINEYEFHLDYNVIINRIRNENKAFTYTALYDLFESGSNTIKQKNPLSDITNPYITTLIKTTVDGVEYIAFSARVRQVKLVTVEKNILTDNVIENKSITFDFEEQLANFDIDVIESNGDIKHLTPIYSGLLDYTVEDNSWCYYEYIGENTIRIIFSRDSYVPKLNALIRVNVSLSDGYSGNFTYNNNFRISLLSEEYNNYNGMYALIYPLMNGISNGGRDKKSISDLKKIIPREASSRGAIINITDLNNFFNSINNNNNHIYFYKKRDNPFERLYYGYLITKKHNTVYPTNTLNLNLDQTDFIGFAGNNNLVIKPGTIFYYYDHDTDVEHDYCTLTMPTYVEGLDKELYPYNMTINKDGNLVRVFEYISPFLITIDDDLITSYLLTIMNTNKTFKFNSINTLSDVQFVTTNMNWRRNFLYNDNGVTKYYDNKYIMTLDMIRNTNHIDKNLVKLTLDSNGNKILSDIRIKVVMVLYADNTETNPYRYVEGELSDYNKNDDIYTFKFVIETDDVMDLNNRINIKGIYNAKPEALQHKDVIANSHGYMNKNTYAKLYILADFGTKPGDEIDGVKVTEETAKIILYGEDGIGNRTEIEAIVPVKNDIIEEFLKNRIYYNDGSENINIISIMKNNPIYMTKVHEYNGNDQSTEAAIFKYIRNNKDSDFMKNTILKDPLSLKVINSYNYLDLDRYTLCNVVSIDGGIDFYHDYSTMMTSTVNVTQIQDTDSSGNLLYKEIKHIDSIGGIYTEYKPIYKKNKNGGYLYNYDIKRIPMLKSGFLSTESSMQDFIFILEERRKYIEECMLQLEDTFGLDFKFVNTYGPSRRFYYIIPNEKTYKVKVKTKKLYVYKEMDESSDVLGSLAINTEVQIIKSEGIWGRIRSPYDGYIKLSDTSRCLSYMDNISITLKFALETVSFEDKTIVDDIKQDIKDYIETINNINEIHMPNIITLITNNYRDRLKYFEFLGVNNYSSACQHLYLDDTINADLCPEFINVSTINDKTLEPNINITVY